MKVEKNTGSFVSGGRRPDTVLALYSASVESGELQPDPHQQLIVEKLQSISDQLAAGPAPAAAEKRGGFSRLLAQFKPKVDAPVRPIQGLYVWGGVGRGKTHLTDLFYDSIPIQEKLRLHFHRFMELVHVELRKHKNVESPLSLVADDFAKRARILVLDEMHVHDITDAMILGELFRLFFQRGISLVTTSNIEPKGLYKNGLQRDRFLPAIALLEEHTDVIHIGGDTDYRMRTLEQANTYHIGCGELTDEKLRKQFLALTGVAHHLGDDSMLINHRPMPVKMWEDGIAWFRFQDLCESARSTSDYIQVAEYCHTVMVSDIPVMTSLRDDAARRFVNMIDEFYDRNVNLIVSAEAEPEGLYKGNRLAFEFDRTISRLREMQSLDYLACEHLNERAG